MPYAHVALPPKAEFEHGWLNYLSPGLYKQQQKNHLPSSPSGALHPKWHQFYHESAFGAKIDGLWPVSVCVLYLCVCVCDFQDVLDTPFFFF